MALENLRQDVTQLQGRINDATATLAGIEHRRGALIPAAISGDVVAKTQANALKAEAAKFTEILADLHVALDVAKIKLAEAEELEPARLAAQADAKEKAEALISERIEACEVIDKSLRALAIAIDKLSLTRNDAIDHLLSLPGHRDLTGTNESVRSPWRLLAAFPPTLRALLPAQVFPDFRSLTETERAMWGRPAPASATAPAKTRPSTEPKPKKERQIA